MRVFPIALLLAGLTATSGCGTAGNLYLPHQKPHIYGGVEFDCMAMQASWAMLEPDPSEPKGPLERLGRTLLLTGLVTLDFPLSFVADTITLPSVLLEAGVMGRGKWDRLWPPLEPPVHILTQPVQPPTTNPMEPSQK